MSNAGAKVFVVDDDPSVRKSLERLFESAGHDAEVFESPQEFLGREPYGGPACLVLDVRLPGMDGFDLQKALAGWDCSPAIVFITAYGDIPMSVQAIKGGAVDFLAKPFNDADLLKAVEQALAKNRQERLRLGEISDIKQRLATLTGRHREVLGHVVAGKANKVIADELGIALRTVKAHRGQIMRRMRAESLAELVRVAGQVGIQGATNGRQPDEDQRTAQDEGGRMKDEG